MAIISLELVPLPVPTHTSIKRPPGRREDGIFPDERVDAMILLNNMDRGTVEQLMDELKQTVLQNWMRANTQGCPR